VLEVEHHDRDRADAVTRPLVEGDLLANDSYFRCPVMLTALVLSAQHLRAHALGPLRRPVAIEEPARLPQLVVEDLRLDAVLAVVAEFHAIAIGVLGKLKQQLA